MPDARTAELRKKSRRDTSPEAGLDDFESDISGVFRLRLASMHGGDAVPALVRAKEMPENEGYGRRCRLSDRLGQACVPKSRWCDHGHRLPNRGRSGRGSSRI